MCVTDFFIQFEDASVKTILPKISEEGLQFLYLLWAFFQDLQLQVPLTGKKKHVLGQKKATNNFFDADHH